MDVAIYGAGALGCAFYGLTGFPVYSRRKPFQFKVTTPNRTILGETLEGTPPKDILVINTQKLYDIVSYSPTTIYTQNGLLPFKCNSRFLVYFGSNQVSKNEFVTRGVPKIVAVLKDKSYLNLFSSLKIEIEEDQISAEWKKLSTFLPIALVASLFDHSNDIILKNPEAQKKAVLVYKEICTLGGLVPKEESFLAGINNYGSNINSLLQDLRSGRRSELEAILEPINSPLIKELAREITNKWKG